jgi:hypothetical protein
MYSTLPHQRRVFGFVSECVCVCNCEIVNGREDLCHVMMIDVKSLRDPRAAGCCPTYIPTYIGIDHQCPYLNQLELDPFGM